MLDVAILAVKEAARIISEKFEKSQKITYKDAEEAVSEVDIEAEKRIRKVINESFPEHHVLGEEEGMSKVGASDYLWIIDPLDGTINYIRGIRLFGISVALAKRRKVILGVVYNPLTKELFTAEKDKGAYLNGNRIRTSQINELTKAIIFISGLYKSHGYVEPLFDKVKNLRIATSSAYEACLIACGKADAFIKVTTHPWGFAAANLIVEEARGKVTDFDGSPWDIDSTHLVASNGLVHTKILDHLKQN